MRIVLALVTLVTITLILVPLSHPPSVSAEDAREWQLTISPINKLLDNNDNFSMDDAFCPSIPAKRWAAASETATAS